MERINELKVFVYRILLAYFFYFIARISFYLINKDLLELDSFYDILNVFFRGFAFDTAAILYVNLLFILLSILPLTINTTNWYQKMLFYLYFVTNIIAYATNFIDIIYYKFSNFRLTTSVFNEFNNEKNGGDLIGSFLLDYWHILLLFIFNVALWVYLYKKMIITNLKVINKKMYFLVSILAFLIVGTGMIGGIRGDFKHSTRPITLVDANRHVSKQQHAVMVLNTPFTIIRTIGKNDFKVPNYFSKEELNKIIKPIKKYEKDSLDLNKPNIVLFIIESYAREYIGALNTKNNIPNYKSYTPFLDSLSNHSLRFDNAFANGRKSIHGMSSVLAGIPSFKVAYTSSPYSNQPTQSLVSCLNDIGYDTSFFHGAANGSMGFLGFGNILGLDHYYGMDEFGDESLSDGVWGIWDEPFLQYTNNVLKTKNNPFFASIFTLTSHDPFKVPEEYNNTFPKGDISMHQVVGYTDYAIKRFFEEAKKEPWFNNTIFVFTADHTNQKFYDFYKGGVNRSAVPLIFYKPDNSLAKLDSQISQQIDIYPTLLDMIGYDKPFRSWGRSLLKNDVKPFAISHTGNVFHYITNDYTCVFDDQKAIGFYAKEDLKLKNNLIKSKNDKMIQIESECKAFIQDYKDRIVNKKLAH